METPTQYRDFADECDRLVNLAKTARERTVLSRMAATWRKLAEEAERKYVKEAG